LARKPETSFIKGVHKYLENTYAEKMCNPYRSGIPDVWYSGNKQDLWVEYKYEPSSPLVLRPELSRQQARWIKQRKREGRNVWVIVGMPTGGTVIKDFNDMLEGLTIYSLMSRKELALYISEYCN
jgi:hypothetical protein